MDFEKIQAFSRFLPYNSFAVLYDSTYCLRVMILYIRSLKKTLGFWFTVRCVEYHFHSFVKKFFKRFFRLHYFFLTSRMKCNWVKALQLFFPLSDFTFFEKKRILCYFCLNQFIGFKKFCINTPRIKSLLDLEQKLKLLDFMRDLFCLWNNQSG